MNRLTEVIARVNEAIFNKIDKSKLPKSVRDTLNSIRVDRSIKKVEESDFVFKVTAVNVLYRDLELKLILKNTDFQKIVPVGPDVSTIIFNK